LYGGSSYSGNAGSVVSGGDDGSGGIWYDNSGMSSFSPPPSSSDSFGTDVGSFGGGGGDFGMSSFAGFDGSQPDSQAPRDFSGFDMPTDGGDLLSGGDSMDGWQWTDDGSTDNSFLMADDGSTDGGSTDGGFTDSGFTDDGSGGSDFSGSTDFEAQF